MDSNTSRLGKGLSALMGGDVPEATPVVGRATVALDRIDRNPHQPRKDFADEDLLQLAESLKNQGMLQPLVVRANGDRFELIAGERRFRAAQVADLATVPISIVEFDDRQVLEAALVENIQRVDLNPIEKGRSFKEYVDKYGVTQEQLAQRLGLDRSSVSNLIGLLAMPEEIQGQIRTGAISMGHAKALKGLGSPDQIAAMAKKVVLEGLSVKATEALIREWRNEVIEENVQTRTDGGTKIEKTPHVLGIETELRQRFATKLEIKLKSKDKGQIVIGFDSTDDFERVIEALRR